MPIIIFIAYFKGPFNFTLNGHGYFYSGWVEEHKSDKVDWLEARNTCREYCMDLASLETPTEDEMIRDFLIKGIIFPQVSFATLANIAIFPCFHYLSCNLIEFFFKT